MTEINTRRAGCTATLSLYAVRLNDEDIPRRFDETLAMLRFADCSGFDSIAETAYSGTHLIQITPTCVQARRFTAEAMCFAKREHKVSGSYSLLSRMAIMTILFVLVLLSWRVIVTNANAKRRTSLRGGEINPN